MSNTIAGQYYDTWVYCAVNLSKILSIGTEDKLSLAYGAAGK